MSRATAPTMTRALDRLQVFKEGLLTGLVGRNLVLKAACRTILYFAGTLLLGFDLLLALLICLRPQLVGVGLARLNSAFPCQR